MKYSNWKDISINKFIEIENIITDQNADDDEKNLSLVCLFNDIDYDEVNSWSIDRYNNELAEVTKFFNQEIPNLSRLEIGELTINGISYKVVRDMKDFSVAQYLDFQSYVKENSDKNMAQVLSTFVIPKGKKYNEGYDISETIGLFGENIDIITGRALVNFFTGRLAKSIQRSLTFYKLTMRMMLMKIGMKKKDRKKIVESLDKMTKVITGCFS